MLLVSIEMSEISSEISVFNFWYLSSENPVFTWARMSGPVAIYRSQKEKRCTWYHCLLPGASCSVTDLHITLDTSLSATLNPRTSFVTPSITHNKPAAFSGSAMFTHSRKLLVAQNRTRLQLCLHCAHTQEHKEGKFAEVNSLTGNLRGQKNKQLPSMYLVLGSQKFLQCLLVTYASIKWCFIIIWQTNKCTFMNMLNHILLWNKMFRLLHLLPSECN